MRYLTFFHLIFLLSFFGLNAQKNNDIILVVGDEAVSRFEFEQIYNKNNQMVSESDRKSLKDYLDLYIVYKLKVAEAKSLGLHTTDAFKRELATYRSQLIQPHLIDKKTEDKIIREAYDRMKYEINASHILISIPENATPDDTLAIYKKIVSIRNRILAGEQFESVARGTSDDPSVKRNGGNLGYFTVFQMVYPFETAAYTTSVDSISRPIRSRFGYHIVKVHDKRISLGQRKAAHIMIAVSQNFNSQQKIDAKAKIDSIYQLILNGGDFAAIAREFSQDPGSARSGGELPQFSKGQMPPEIENVVFSMKNPGEISQPVQSQFGWHIIKLIEKKIVGSFDEMLPEIKSRLTRDERGRISQKTYLAELKRKYGYEVDSTALKTMYSVLDTNVYKGTWELPSKLSSKLLYRFASVAHPISELAQRITLNYSQFDRLPYKEIVNRTFNEMVGETIIAFEENRLITENPDMFYLLKEYHDGILLFEVMDKLVWSKASQDNEGLEKFYSNHIHNYSWNERVYAKKYITESPKTAKKLYKYLTTKQKGQLEDNIIIKKFMLKADTLVRIDPLVVLPENPIVSGYNSWPLGISQIISTNGSNTIVRIVEVKKNEPKPLNEVRGQVIADYQEYLEKEWIETLKAKYKVTINQKILDELTSNQN